MFNSISFSRNSAGQQERQDIFKLLKGKSLQPRLLYLARISFKTDKEIKSFSDKQKLREFTTTKPALQQMLKGLIQSRYKRRKRSTKSNPNQLRNGNRNIHINNYFKCKWIKCSKRKKKDRLAEWIQKQDQYICCLQETHFIPKDTYGLKVRGWKNIFHANGKQNKSRAAILISDKIDLKIKTITSDTEGHYIMIKGSIQEEDITILNI